MNHITRRGFLIGSATAGGSALVAAAHAKVPTLGLPRDKGLADLILECISDCDSAAALGRCYAPALARTRCSTHELCMEIVSNDLADFAVAPLQARAQWLDQRIRDDFGHGRTAEIDGWVLSRTEALLLALAASV